MAGVFGDDLIIAVPPTARKLKSSALIRVASVTGRNTKVGVKKISIQDRHKLHKEHDWLPADFEKFPFEYQDLPAAVYKAGSWIMGLDVSTVRRQEELAVEKRIMEAKRADSQGFGIDQLNTLQTFEDFKLKLMTEAKLTEEEATLEWNRRLHLPNEYDRDTDPQGRLMIELRMDAFKERLQEVKKREQTQAKKLEDARKAIAAAVEKGEIEPMEKAIQVAEVETTMSDEELVAAKTRLESWREADGQLLEAISVRKTAVIRNALTAAEEAGLKNQNCDAASTLYRQLIVEAAQAQLQEALQVGEIENLEQAIEKAEKDMAGISEKGVKEAREQLGSWRKLEEEITAACESKVLSELKKGVDAAASIGFRSREVALAKQLLAEQCATDLEELESAMKLGSPKKLHSVLQDLAEKNELAAEDLKRGQECLKAQQSGYKALEDAMASPQIDSLKQALRAAEEAKLQGPLREEAEKKLQEMEQNSELEQALQEADRIEAQPTVELPGEANT